jgi:hypothetical protein
MESNDITDSAALSDGRDVSGRKGSQEPRNPGREFTLTRPDGTTQEYVRFNVPDMSGSFGAENRGTIGLVEITRASGDTEFLLAQAMNDNDEEPFDDDDEDLPILYDTDEEIDILFENGELHNIDDPDTEDEDDIDFGFEQISLKDVLLDDADEFEDDAVLRQ